MTSGVFPKENGQILYAQDVNMLYGNFIGMRSTEAETAMNIAKLQYCQSVTDISHDYMVVDVFTDANGYNNSVCTADSTSTFCSTGLNGYYLSGSTPSTTIYHCQLECSGSASLGNYFTIAQGHFTCICNSNGSARACVCNQFCLDDIICISFCLQIQLQKQYIGLGGSSCGIISNWHDDWSAGHTSNTVETCTYTRCYAYSLISAGCYCFYCNGSGKCEVAMNTFPNIVFCSIGSKGGTDTTIRTARVCMINFSNTCSEDTLITTIPIEYATPAQTSYLALDKVGTGTVVYNVYDATTDTLIGENLLPNTLNDLSACVECHYYVLKQCSDGVSCIKSYAILAGVY